MKKYNLGAEEKEWLKVAKLNQHKSELLSSEVERLKRKWGDKIQIEEDFLSRVEKQLGITTPTRINRKETFVSKSGTEEEFKWSELVAEAEEQYSDDINFEDLLNEAEFLEAYTRLEEIDREFEEKTGLRKRDLVFLGVAVALQCARQYILDPWLKDMRNTATINDEKGRKNNAEAGWYYVETGKILMNRVPYDVQQYGDKGTIQGFLKGGNHREMTLGHDPILGWIFGTANIMTSTVTRRDFVSAHVKCINNTNKIYSLANTGIIFTKVMERVAEEGIDGKIALASAIIRELLHLKSDFYTKRGLPLPGISTISPELSKILARYGIDVAGVGTEVSLSCLVNTIISIVHRLYLDEEKGEEQFYEIRTRKIILYSNLIASTSNIIVSKFTKRYNLLDIGGILVTIVRLITDVRFMCKIKDEFVQNKLDIQFEAINSELESLSYGAEDDFK